MNKKWKYPIIVITAILVISMPVQNGTLVANDGPQTEAPTRSTSHKKAALMIGRDETDLGFSWVAIQGMYELRDKYNWSISISRQVAFPDQYNVANDYGAAGYDVVFMVGGQFIETSYFSGLPDKYNQTVWVQIPGLNFSHKENLVGLHPAFQTEGYYLAGVLAGLMTETNRMGVVFGEWYEYLSLEFYAFEAGVKSVNNDSLVYARVAGTWDDAAIGIQITETLIDTKNVDIVVEEADATGMGVIAACIGANISIIGAVADQWTLAPNNTITSIGMNITLLMEIVAQRIENGTAMSVLGGTSWDIPIGNYLYPYHNYDSRIPQSVKDKVDLVKAGIANGSIVVPRISTEDPPADPPEGEIDSVTATNPSGLVAWEAGTTHAITWNSTGSIANVKIELYISGINDSILTASTPNDGLFSWTIPSGLGNSTQYQIKITDVTDSAAYDFSDYFEIYTPPAPADSITVTNPSGLVAWEAGTTHAITWNSTGSIANVKIELYISGINDSILTANTPNDGLFSWTIPSGLGNSTQYQIKINDATDSAIYDFSDYFGIYSGPLPSLPSNIPGYNIIALIGISSVITLLIIKKQLIEK